MNKILIQYAMCALAIALMATLAPAQAQPAGIQAAYEKISVRFPTNSPDSRA
jgi:hypothetical protein